jgi:hypothetical protein
MALKMIENKAIIDAEDRTGQTFAQVAQKLRQMEDRAASALKRLASITKAAQTAQSATSKVERAPGIASAIGGMVTTVIAAESIRALAEAIGNRISAGVRMETAGMSPAEIERAKVAAELSQQYPTLSQDELGRVLIN